jgi:menaquinone-dependent protoporphyrinogen oxidase
MQVLIAFGTRYGATKETAEEIAKVLQEHNIEVRVVDLAKESINNLEAFDLVMVGSGVKKRWTREARRFLKRNRKVLQGKKTALFISSGWPTILRAEGNTAQIEEIRQTHLVEMANAQGLHPIALGLFNGIWEFPDIDSFGRKWYKEVLERIEKLGFEGEGDHYDFRDWTVIRHWAQELAKKVREEG